MFSQLEKVRAAYHKCCQKEQTALDKEKQANEDAETSPEKKQKLASARENATEDKEKVKAAQSNMSSSICKASKFMTVVGQWSTLHSNDVLHICCMW